MSYSTGMLNKRIQIYQRAEEQGSTFGKSGQPKYQLLGDFWANETFSKGVKALHEGALDAYDTVMFHILELLQEVVFRLLRLLCQFL